jgi:hypothetical protein
MRAVCVARRFSFFALLEPRHIGPALRRSLPRTVVVMHGLRRRRITTDWHRLAGRFYGLRLLFHEND